jgi:hypothetical protein
MRVRWRSALWWATAALAAAIATPNVFLSVAGFAFDVDLPWGACVTDIQVPTKVAAVLLLHCALAHTAGLLFQWISEVRSRAGAGVGTAALSVAAAWTALFNIRSLLAPGFTFSTGSVVMTNPYILVVSVYLACACISLGFIFLNGSVRAGRSRPQRSVYVSAVQGLCFIFVGIVAAA